MSLPLVFSAYEDIEDITRGPASRAPQVVHPSAIGQILPAGKQIC